jgi:hypothetical protein
LPFEEVLDFPGATRARAQRWLHVIIIVKLEVTNDLRLRLWLSIAAAWPRRGCVGVFFLPREEGSVTLLHGLLTGHCNNLMASGAARR